MTAEWRVVWKREGTNRRVRRVRNEARAKAFVLYLEGRYEEATGHKRDEEYGTGLTWGQHWDDFLTRDGEPLRALEYARVDLRPVGVWTALETHR
jgi:hypothetical protein